MNKTPYWLKFHFIGNCDVIAKGEVGLGTFGFKAKLGAQNGGYFGEEFGLGGVIKFEKPKKEESWYASI